MGQDSQVGGHKNNPLPWPLQLLASLQTRISLQASDIGMTFSLLEKWLFRRRKVSLDSPYSVSSSRTSSSSSLAPSPGSLSPISATRNVRLFSSKSRSTRMYASASQGEPSAHQKQRISRFVYGAVTQGDAGSQCRTRGTWDGFLDAGNIDSDDTDFYSANDTVASIDLGMYAKGSQLKLAKEHTDERLNIQSGRSNLHRERQHKRRPPATTH
jgi:hypothetical protein